MSREKTWMCSYGISIFWIILSGIKCNNPTKGRNYSPVPPNFTENYKMLLFPTENKNDLDSSTASQHLYSKAYKIMECFE